MKSTWPPTSGEVATLLPVYKDLTEGEVFRISGQHGRFVFRSYKPPSPLGGGWITAQELEKGEPGKFRFLSPELSFRKVKTKS